MTAERHPVHGEHERPPRASVARAVLGILLGYGLFALFVISLFAVSGHDPHLAPSRAFLFVSVAWGVACAVLSGYVATVVAGRGDLVAGVGVALLIALAASTSMVMQPDATTLWSQLAAIIVMAPAAVIGAALRRRRA